MFMSCGKSICQMLLKTDENFIFCDELSFVLSLHLWIHKIRSISKLIFDRALFWTPHNMFNSWQGGVWWFFDCFEKFRLFSKKTEKKLDKKWENLKKYWKTRESQKSLIFVLTTRFVCAIARLLFRQTHWVSLKSNLVTPSSVYQLVESQKSESIFLLSFIVKFYHFIIFNWTIICIRKSVCCKVNDDRT